MPPNDTTETTVDTVDTLEVRAQGTHALMGVLWVHPSYRFSPFSGRGAVSFGRSSSVSYPLEGRRVSRKHAELSVEPPLIVLRDCDSRNGTHVNGVRVTEQALKFGDVIRLGDWVGVLLQAAPNDVAHAIPSEVQKGLIAGMRLKELLRRAAQVAQSQLSVILAGATGAGKEVLARFIHNASKRPGPFVAVNCAALPETLAEAMLFGHKKGAFTGADRDQPGFFRAAHEGTLLLDEILELPAALQAKLLRALEERAVTPVGQIQPLSIDVRVISAAQSDLSQAVAAGKFRADLYARLNGIELNLPSLKEQPELVPALFSMVLDEVCAGAAPKPTAEVVERLCLYDWPFNAREVVQLARQIGVLHADKAELDITALPERMRAALPEQASVRRPEQEPAPAEPVAARLERLDGRRSQQLNELVEALRVHHGNVSKAAHALGISRQQAYRLMDLKPDLELADLRVPKPTP